jgi:hypothetical protein
MLNFSIGSPCAPIQETSGFEGASNDCEFMESIIELEGKLMAVKNEKGLI